MHAGRTAEHLEPRAELVRDRFRKGTPALAVDLSHPPYVTGKMPLRDEVRENRLIQGGWKDIHRLADRHEAANKVVGDDDVADAQGGEQDLAECPYVDDPRVPIESLEGRDGEASVAIFAVVVVLDNPRTVILRPGQ